MHRRMVDSNRTFRKTDQDKALSKSLPFAGISVHEVRKTYFTCFCLKVLLSASEETTAFVMELEIVWYTK